MNKNSSFGSAKISLFVLMMSVLSSCFERDEYSDIPNIAFTDIQFVNTQTIDSLILSFSFEDENGDIGLNDSDREKPFQIFDVITDSENEVVKISDTNLKLPLYASPTYVSEQPTGDDAFIYDPKLRELFSETDNRPAFNCEDYNISENDTFYIRKNPYYKNIYIEFQRKSGENYQPIDFQKVFNKNDCSLGEFDARIPVFLEGARKGEISYAMISQAFGLAFDNDTIRIKFYIYDRAQHKSNEEFSKDFVLKDITINK